MTSKKYNEYLNKFIRYSDKLGELNPATQEYAGIKNKIDFVEKKILEMSMHFDVMHYYYNKKKYKFHRNEKNELTFECLGE